MADAMTKLVIDGVPPWDGEYEMPDFFFTNRELFRIKTICGTRAGELLEALGANDTGAFVAVAAVVLERYGKSGAVDDLWDAKVGSIRLDLGGADADPPPAGEVAPGPSDDPAASGPSSETGGG